MLCEHLETHPLQSIRDRYRDETSSLRRLVEVLSAQQIRDIIQSTGSYYMVMVMVQGPGKLVLIGTHL